MCKDAGVFIITYLVLLHVQVNQNQSCESVALFVPFVSSKPRRSLTAVPQLRSLNYNTSTAQAEMHSADMLKTDYTVGVPYKPDTHAAGTGARSLLAAADGSNVSSANVWFGYDVERRAYTRQVSHEKAWPRYIGMRNQVLGGLYIKQVSLNVTSSA